MTRSTVGVLALQGDFAAHQAVLEDCGASAVEVRLPTDLARLRGLIMPGGESTTMLRLMREYGFDRAIPRFAAEGGGLFGTCAGAILMASRVTSPSQWSLELMDIEVERNAYGRQIDSFEAELTEVSPDVLGPGEASERSPLKAAFIRAPRILRTGRGVDVLASWRGDPVLARQGRLLVSTFHPEIAGEGRVHRYFLRDVIERG